MTHTRSPFQLVGRGILSAALVLAAASCGGEGRAAGQSAGGAGGLAGLAPLSHPHDAPASGEELFPSTAVRELAGGAAQRIALLDTGLAAAYAEACPGCRATTESGETRDDTGHGTGLAAVISGLSSLGWSGVAPDAQVTVVPLAPALTDLVRKEALVAAVDRAVEQDFDIINISMGAQTPDPALRDSVARAIARGITVVSAAGPDPSGIVLYPAGFPGVMAAAAPAGGAAHSHSHGDDAHDHAGDAEADHAPADGDSPALVPVVAVPLSAIELPRYDAAGGTFTMEDEDHSSTAAAVLTGLIAGHRSAAGACSSAPPLETYLDRLLVNAAEGNSLLDGLLEECIQEDS